MKSWNKEFFLGMAERSIRTFCQTLLGLITVGATISEINWGYILSVAVVSAITCVLMCMAGGIPESKTASGVLKYDGNKFDIVFDDTLEELEQKSTVTLTLKKEKDV